MKPHDLIYLGIEAPYCDLDTAKTVIVPFGYEGGVSYGRGTAQAPRAVLEASAYVELYDEQLDQEPYRTGVATVDIGPIARDAETMITQIKEVTFRLMEQGRFVIVIGGDHSISSGIAQAAIRLFPELGVVQFDAHADLRDTYEGSPLSHACAMARIREMTTHTLQLGIRSLSAEEARLIRKDNLQVGFMHLLRSGRYDWRAAIDRLPGNVFLTIDVDVFDWNVVRSTGTPEPGGMSWDECLACLDYLFAAKNVVGCDVVELSFRDDDPNSIFAVAKLIHKIIGFKFRS